MDSAIRMAIINEVRTALRAVSEQLEERYVTAEELSKQFSFFTREWIKDYGHLLPRERVIVVKDNLTPTTHWGYPLHKITRMVGDGSFRVLEYKEKMKAGNLCGQTAKHTAQA